MKKNVGSADRIIRIVLGLAIIALGLVYKCWLGAIGIVVLLTAVCRVCPAYTPFGINTAKKEDQ
jgi:type IV secretory pathway TrbD component